MNACIPGMQHNKYNSKSYASYCPLFKTECFSFPMRTNPFLSLAFSIPVHSCELLLQINVLIIQKDFCMLWKGL